MPHFYVLYLHEDNYRPLTWKVVLSTSHWWADRIAVQAVEV